MAHNISTVSLSSCNVSIKPLKTPATLCYFFTHDFSIKFITLFQIEAMQCWLLVMLLKNLLVSTCHKRNSLQPPQTCCLTTQHIKQYKTNVNKVEYTLK